MNSNSKIYINDTDCLYHLKEAIQAFSEEICSNRQLLSFRLHENISTLMIRQKSLYDVQQNIETELRNAKDEYESCLYNSGVDEDGEEEESDCQQEEEKVQELECLLKELQDDIEQTESIIMRIQSLAEDIDNKSFSYQNLIITLAEDTSSRLDKTISQTERYNCP